MSKNVVIVGAGYAGILTAKKLARKIRKARLQDEIKITIIDRNPFHTMLTELHEVAGGRVDESSIKIGLDKVFAGREVDVRMDTVREIDFARQVVRGSAADYDYDYVVIAAGSKPTFFGTEGAAEHAFQLWSYDDAVQLKIHIEDMFRKASRETDPAVRRKLLTFYVVGAGFTGVEMAGELAEFKHILCEKFSVPLDEVRIIDVDMLQRTVPTLSEKQSLKVAKRLEKMGVVCILETNVIKISQDSIDLQQGDQLMHDETATVIWAAGIQSADITRSCSEKLTAPDLGRGRIEVTEYLNSPCDDKVYIIGDNMFFVPEGETRPVFQMVENCEQSSACCANNLFAVLRGSGNLEKYRPKFHGCMVSIGSRYGVAEVGTDKTKISLASFFAMFVKHMINIVYYIQVQGWNKVVSYIKHEFFTIRHQRSFVGGHFSNRTPSFLLLPLRVWLGLVWVYEAVMKIVDGWFDEPKLTKFFNDARSWYDSILGTITTSAAAAADTTSSATGNASEGAGQLLFNIRILFLRFQLIAGKALEDSTLNDIAFRLNIPFVDRMIDKFILPYPGMQLFFQIAIVVAELLVGFSIMGGLFTTLGSGVSLILQLMFVMTTGLYLGTFWMIFAAIAVLIGGGRTFGLDYYAMPALKKLWQKVRWARKWYLYHD
ncbi:MAG TPA: pyridine nucleotide-disulfide oxidoreductase [Clostridiales bacterium]|nr:pyridine nucleotide-disulfide oxidoreductase [Clostridiales bacterium]